jgi:hypothetical protein
MFLHLGRAKESMVMGFHFTNKITSLILSNIIP